MAATVGKGDQPDLEEKQENQGIDPEVYNADPSTCSDPSELIPEMKQPTNLTPHLSVQNRVHI